MATETVESLLLPAKAAKRIRLEEGTLAAWRSKGRTALPFVNVGHLVRYRSADLDAFIERQVRFAA